MLGNLVQVDVDDVDRWCRRHLASGLDRVLFVDGHLSTVIGIALSSGESVVVKVRHFASRLVGCSAVHRRFFERGFPCPEPIVDLEPLGDFVASAEAMVYGGDLFPSTGRSPAAFAAALAWLVDLAPAPTQVPSLEPTPPWTHPGRAASQLWPAPDDRDIDLNRVDGPDWVDTAGRAARSRLEESTSPLIVGHGDWYTGNLRWAGESLHIVWDWDSIVALPEAAVAGLAAAVYPANGEGSEATVEESDAFLAAYEAARGRTFTDSERRIAWAAGLWNRSFDAKKQFATEGVARSLSESEAIGRQRRAHSA